MNLDKITGQIRHGMTSAGGGLILHDLFTKGLPTDVSAVDAFGAAIMLAGFVWSWRSK